MNRLVFISMPIRETNVNRISTSCQTAVDLRAGTASKTYHSWITFRFGEFYLNYAEAVYKYLGSPYATDNEFTTSAVDAIKVVRTRAEMPGFPQGMTNDAFWKKYQNERMVELAFEGHRFWDVRRWKEGDKHFKNIVEMKITKNGDDTYTYERKVKKEVGMIRCISSRFRRVKNLRILIWSRIRGGNPQPEC